jgi:hypothetical protein
MGRDDRSTQHQSGPPATRPPLRYAPRSRPIRAADSEMASLELETSGGMPVAGQVVAERGEASSRPPRAGHEDANGASGRGSQRPGPAGGGGRAQPRRTR